MISRRHWQGWLFMAMAFSLWGTPACDPGLVTVDAGAQDAATAADAGTADAAGTTADAAHADTATAGHDAQVGQDAAAADHSVTPDAAAHDTAAAQPDAGGGADASMVPSTHTDDQDGVMHNVGKEDPLRNCVSCHGPALQGGEGPSCYDCHDNSDHTISRRGYMHRSGTRSSCNACHGPNNSGGLGPACSTCH